MRKDHCPKCGRGIYNGSIEHATDCKGLVLQDGWIRYYWDTYGCDTGCDGHSLAIYDGEELICSQFEFIHSKEHIEEWAREWSQAYGLPIKWDRCVLRT